MKNDKEAFQEKRDGFPQWRASSGGMIPGLVALFNNVSSPLWITFNVIVIVAAFGFAAANLAGLAVNRYRGRGRQSRRKS